MAVLLRRWLQTPQSSKRQLLSLSKTLIQGVKSKDIRNGEHGQIKKIFLNLIKNFVGILRLKLKFDFFWMHLWSQEQWLGTTSIQIIKSYSSSNISKGSLGRGMRGPRDNIFWEPLL